MEAITEPLTSATKRSEQSEPSAKSLTVWTHSASPLNLVLKWLMGLCFGECGPKIIINSSVVLRSFLEHSAPSVFKSVSQSVSYLRQCCPWRSQSGWWPLVDPPGRLRCHPVGDPLHTGQRSPGRGYCWNGSCCCCLVAGYTGWCWWGSLHRGTEHQNQF